MNFRYDFPNIIPADNKWLSLFLVLYAAAALVAVAYGVAVYVLRSASLCGIAKRRGIRGRALAWLPVLRLWVLGSIADQFQYVAKGAVRNRRKLLLATVIAIPVLWTVTAAGFAGLFFDLYSGTALANALLCALLLVIGGLLLVVTQILCLVLQYICYYNLYTSCDPATAAVLEILSILFPVTIPFFLAASRKKDLGMPPRKQNPRPDSVCPQSATAVTAEPEADKDDFVL